MSFTPEEVKSGSAFYNNANIDVGTTDREGVSVFYKDQSSAVFHSYSSYARGIDLLNTAYNYLDPVPKGRDEDEHPRWIHHHDKY